MPIFFQKDIDLDTKLGIWKIEEDEDFFLKKAMPQRNVSHPHKKLQHLAGRYLLKHLYPDFPTQLIMIADTRKPYLEDEAYHFSISHCGNYAAAIVSKTKRVGVDIEVPTIKVDKIKHKFLSEEEQNIANNQWVINYTSSKRIDNSDDVSIEQNKRNNSNLSSQTIITSEPEYANNNEPTIIDKLTLFWSCKEAAFKWYGLGEVDFKDHMVIEKIKQISADNYQIEICFRKDYSLLLTLNCCFFKELFLSYVVA